MPLIFKLFNYFEKKQKRSVVASGALLTVVATSDYLVGPDVSLLVFYLIPVCFATWFVGKRFGSIMAVLSITLWAFSNSMAADAYSKNPFISGWNAVSAFVVFVIIIFLLANLELFVKQLEERVEERTVAMRKLEREILEITERERRSIGHDLHDSVCQLLTATTLAMKVLEKKLEAQNLREAEDIKEIKLLNQKAIKMTRDMARGLSPVALTSEGLMDAFHQLAERINENHDIFCVVDYDDPLFIKDVNTATQLFLITQEAVTNSVKHSKGSRIIIRLKKDFDFIQITVEDNGIGLDREKNTDNGMGLRIMESRAVMIGAELRVLRNAPNGTLILCKLPTQSLHRNT